MPKREEKPKASGSRPRRSAVKEEAKKATEEKGAVEENKTVKKNPLEAKVKKYIKDVSPDIADKVDEIIIRNVKDEEGNKSDCAFLTFTAGSKDEVENELENVMCIKDLLFAYHTNEQDGVVKGKHLMIEVLAPEDEESPYIVVFQEVANA